MSTTSAAFTYFTVSFKNAPRKVSRVIVRTTGTDVQHLKAISLIIHSATLTDPHVIQFADPLQVAAMYTFDNGQGILHKYVMRWQGLDLK